MGIWRWIKGHLVKVETEVEIPRDVETMASEPREPRVRMPRLITPYEEIRTMVGMRPPALKLYSADPYYTMKARTADGLDIPLLPGVPYPITWNPAERWPVLSDTEKSLEFSIPLGRTFAVSGIMKMVETEAFALVPIVQMPYGWSRIGIIGRRQFSLDVVSADFSTRAELAQKCYETEHLIKLTQETAFRELLGFAKNMPEQQRPFIYNEMLRGLGLGGVDKLLGAKDPEATLTKLIEDLTRKRDEIKKSKR